jgi:hypothetical protein
MFKTQLLVKQVLLKTNLMDGLWEWFQPTGVWVGCEDRSARFKTITYGQGATAALPI